MGGAGFSVAAGPVVTADQRAAESLARRLVAAPAMQKKMAGMIERLRRDPAASTRDGAQTLARAVDEFSCLAALGAANSDPAHPRIVWTFPPPHRRAGHEVAGSRWGIDNPDHVYRFMPIRGGSRYEIRVEAPAACPTQFSFLLYQSYLGEDGKESTLDTPIAGLRDRDIQRESDGSFTITVDSEPAQGRRNHIQSSDLARILWARNTFSDWSRENPLTVSVRRVGGAPISVDMSEHALAARAATFLEAGTEAILRMKNGELNGPLAGFSNKGRSNVVVPPILRGGAWGFMAPGNFRLEDNEALVVTVHPLEAKYLGFQLSDPWTLSLDVPTMSSMNSRQAIPNADGTYTYVIGAQDPDVHNWLDTGGLRDGLILVRWQVLPEGIKSVDGALRKTEVVKLPDLESALPPGTVRVTNKEREKRVAERISQYARRYTA